MPSAYRCCCRSLYKLKSSPRTVASRQDSRWLSKTASVWEARSSGTDPEAVVNPSLLALRSESTVSSHKSPANRWSRVDSRTRVSAREITECNPGGPPRSSFRLAAGRTSAASQHPRTNGTIQNPVHRMAITASRRGSLGT